MRHRLAIAAAVSAAAQAQVSILTPANNSVVTRSVVGFSWAPPPAPGQSYGFRVIDEQTGAQVLGATIVDGLAGHAYTLPNGSYRVEMREPLTTVLFTVANGPTPTVAPEGVSCQLVNDANQNRLNCSWMPTMGADFYFAHVVQPNTGPGGGALTVAGTQAGQPSTSLLIPNGAASFVVRACTGDGCGPFSGPVQVNAGFGNPAAPTLAEPFSGSIVDGGAGAPVVTFTWNLVAGDSQFYLYRLYVQDFTRNEPALDVVTSNNYYAAYLNPGRRYDALVMALPFTTPFYNGPPRSPTQSAPSGFVTRGKTPNAPSVFAPTLVPSFGATAPFIQLPVVPKELCGQVLVKWTDLPDALGGSMARLYQVELSSQLSTLLRVTTSQLSVAFPVVGGNLQAGGVPRRFGVRVRACATGTTCAPGSETGWGPWSGSGTAEGGSGGFSLCDLLVPAGL
jgi:hypothetical protein